MNPWIKLWELVTCEGEPYPTIEVTEDEGYVILVHADGSRGGWEWYDGNWRSVEPLDTCPCDVAARDAF